MEAPLQKLKRLVKESETARGSDWKSLLGKKKEMAAKISKEDLKKRHITRWEKEHKGQSYKENMIKQREKMNNHVYKEPTEKEKSEHQRTVGRAYND